MKNSPKRFSALLSLTLCSLWFLFLPGVVNACSVCFGDPGDPVSKGVRFAVITLMGVTGVVLGGFGAFFIYLAGKSRNRPEDADGLSQRSVKEKLP